jgi:hypothetical protein
METSLTGRELDQVTGPSKHRLRLSPDWQGAADAYAGAFVQVDLNQCRHNKNGRPQAAVKAVR